MINPGNEISRRHQRVINANRVGKIRDIGCLRVAASAANKDISATTRITISKRLTEKIHASGITNNTELQENTRLIL